MAVISRNHPRKIAFTTNQNPYAAGSVIAEFGNTKVHITASIEDGVPPWLKGKGQGWLTAEYGMLPGSTNTRTKRERKEISGRSQEIQRLIGRSLRAVIDLKKTGEKTITLDCDVLVADGGTRTVSITGAYVALAIAVKKLLANGTLKQNPLTGEVAAISVGITKDRTIIADLNYEEDSSCLTDMNVVMTADGRFIEIQGTAEGAPFEKNELDAMISCAAEALKNVLVEQKKALA